MIEKIMKAVKSSNKRRSVNVTIAAVVGMLLSCTSVMGTDVTGLEIKNDTGIIFVDRDGREFIPGEVGDPYLENTWDEESNTYTNNTVIFVESADGKAYGLKLSGVNFVNNGSIAGISTNSSNNGYGIYNKDGSIGNITNTGRISGRYYAIYNEDGSIGSITNTGTIISSTYGIGNASSLSTSSITSLINTGNISGSMKGISNNGSSSSIGEIINSGTISGSSGIENYSSTIGKLTNSGIIHGRTNVIYNYGTISNSNNYGLLISNSSSATLSRVTLTNNYGLIFKDYSEKYTATEGDFEKFGIISTEGEYTVINAKAKNDDKDNIGGTENLILEEGTLSYGDSETEVISPDKKYVFNGITDTLKVSGENNKLNNSRVNAYDTAVVMGEDNSILTLNNTVVNGGMKADTTTVNITGEGNKFTAKGNSVINVKDEGTAITVTGSDNAVVLEGNAIVNGEMKSTGSRNILDLNGTGKYGMNMHYDITGFAKMSIDNNVTFFEDMTVTGANEVTVEGTGVLSLRLKKEDLTTTAYGDTKPPTATHAFSGRTGKHQMTIIGNSPEEAGTLNFITNGIGKEILVDMENIELENMKIKTNFIIDKVDLDTYKDEGYIHLGAGSDLGGIINPKVNKYNSLNKIYKSIYNSTDENLDGLRDILSLSTYLGKNYDYNNRIEAEKEEQLASLLGYLTSIYIESPYSYSSELSRRSVGMFRDIVTENEFRPNQDKWLIMGGLTHADGGTKDTYYGQNYHGIDSGSSDTKADMKLTGAYMLGKYGYSENLSLGLTLGGNKSEAKMDMSKVKGNSGYLGAFVENYRGNLTLKTGAGIQYSEYDADRAFGGYSNSDKYSDMTYDIYLNGRYSHQVGENLFLEPYGTLSYTYIKQDGADGGNKTLAIETDSKSFDYTVGKVGVDLKKVIPHEKGKSTLSAGVSYTKILDGADEEHITGRFKGGSDFDILVAHKNEHSLGVNAKYALELENGILFDVKGTYSVERDSHNNSGKNRTKGEWIVGAGLGYKF